MPFKNKKYAQRYMREYRKFKENQHNALVKAIESNDLVEARKVLWQKPKIHVKKVDGKKIES